MKKTLALFSTIFLLLPMMTLAQDVLPGFNANILLPDAAFNDTKTFGGPEGIQRFLETKGSVLANTSSEFLSKLREPNDPALKAALGDPRPNLGRLRTAAELIWDAAQASGLNPQVILVTLNKEQGLIGNALAPDRLQRALNHAMGFDCPDGSGCGNLFPGFYYQLFGNVDTQGNKYLGATKSLMRSFNTPGGRGPTVNGVPAKVGENVILNNTLGDFTGIFVQQIVTLGNRATAALYRYTPHVFNGNYNFWKFFTSWFRYPNGTILVSSFDRTYFIIEDGARLRLPFFVADVRKLDVTTAITASPTEIDSYPAGPTYGPPDNTVVQAGAALFVFQNNVMHPVSPFVLKQRKLDTTTVLPLSEADSALFVPGSQLTPTDGTVIRGITDTKVYRVDHGVLKRYSAFTFNQRGAAKILQKIPDEEIASYPKDGFVAPLDGTVVKTASSDAYLVSQERRLPLTPELFKNRGYTTKNVVTLTSDEELASLPLGPPATPAEGTFFSYGDDRELFIFKDGAKHPISPFVAKNRGITADYVFEVGIASTWPDGIAIPPRDGTLIKSDKASTVYIVMNGQLRALTGEIFKHRGLSFKNVATMPDSDLAALPKGGFAPPADNTYFTTAKTDGKIYVYQNGVKRYIAPFVATQRGMTPDFIFPGGIEADWPDGPAVTPRNSTLVKSTNSPTYVVINKELRPLSEVAFKNRGYKLKNVKMLPAADIDALPKGVLITK